MSRIKLKNIEFDAVPFRKLKNITINFANRITLIAGHNGIGKSTILGLVANSSGLTSKSKAPKSYFGKTFQANLSEIIFIDYEKEFIKAIESNSIPRPAIKYEIGKERELFSKRCALTDRSINAKARIVPRNLYPLSGEFTSKDKLVIIGDSSKVPIPTIYLGMTRILPLGEANKNNVYNEIISQMHNEDRELITGFINDIIIGADAKQIAVTSNRIKGTKKFSSHPKYSYDTRCVSLGQDSLGSIAGAIASFQMLSREWIDYDGGLLIIDELDSGFHPHAIKRLVDRLEKEADRLNLQIISTTHSPTLIKAIYSKSHNKQDKNKVVYLADTKMPHLINDATLEDILNEMELIPPSFNTTKTKLTLRVYMEDEEALEIFNILIPGPIKRKLSREYGITIKPIAMGVGCDSLANLTLIDAHFKLSIFALDADSNLKPKHKRLQNIVLLPGSCGKSPERTLFNFINSIIDNPDLHEATWSELRKKKISSDYIKEYMLNWSGNVSKRKEAKKWWRDRSKYIKEWKLFEAWIIENSNLKEQFITEFSTAVKHVSKLIRRLAKMPPD